MNTNQQQNNNQNENKVSFISSSLTFSTSQEKNLFIIQLLLKYSQILKQICSQTSIFHQISSNPNISILQSLEKSLFEISTNCKTEQLLIHETLKELRHNIFHSTSLIRAQSIQQQQQQQQQNELNYSLQLQRQLQSQRQRQSSFTSEETNIKSDEELTHPQTTCETSDGEEIDQTSFSPSISVFSPISSTLLESSSSPSLGQFQEDSISFGDNVKLVEKENINAEIKPISRTVSDQYSSPSLLICDECDGCDDEMEGEVEHEEDEVNEGKIVKSQHDIEQELQYEYIDDGKRQKRLNKSATAKLTQWLVEHLEKPFPSQEEKILIASNLHLTPQQVGNWMTNMRKRHVYPILSGKKRPKSSLDFTILEKQARLSKIEDRSRMIRIPTPVPTSLCRSTSISTIGSSSSPPIHTSQSPSTCLTSLTPIPIPPSSSTTITIKNCQRLEQLNSKFRMNSLHQKSKIKPSHLPSQFQSQTINTPVVVEHINPTHLLPNSTSSSKLQTINHLNKNKKRKFESSEQKQNNNDDNNEEINQRERSESEDWLELLQTLISNSNEINSITCDENWNDFLLTSEELSEIKWTTEI